MPDYQELKDKLIVHKQKILYGVCAVLIFLIGYGTGQAHKQPKVAPPQSQYSSFGPPKQTNTAEAGAPAPQVAGDATAAKATSGQSPAELAKAGLCIIKGTSSKIYHLKGGQFYDRITKPVACFNTEAEAQAAGYRKSSR